MAEGNFHTFGIKNPDQVAFAQVNVEAVPELALPGLSPEHLPAQLIIGAGLMRYIDVAITAEVSAETAQAFSQAVLKMIGS